MSLFRKFIKAKKGTASIEYGLIAALFAIGAIGALASLGGGVKMTTSAAAKHQK